MINEEMIVNTLKDSWGYNRIIKVVYGVEEDFENNFVGNLDLTFKVTLLSTMEPFKLKIRYHEINDLTIQKALTFPLTKGLIIRDLKKEGIVSWQECQVTTHKRGVDEDVLRKIEGNLQLELPRDFRILLRNAIKLPTSFVVLAEPPNSIIVMNTENNPYVIW